MQLPLTEKPKTIGITSKLLCQFTLSAGGGCDSPVLLACSHPHEAGLSGGHRRGKFVASQLDAR